LLDALPALRPAIVVAKTDAGIRRDAIATLRAAAWVRSNSVELRDVEQAESNEDDFDACVTAAALLRCALEGTPLCPPHLESTASEGAILGTGSVNLRLPHQTFASRRPERVLAPPIVRTVTSPADRIDRARIGGVVRESQHVYHCPIAGCEKVFRGSRGGWDGHVGSLRLHPEWHPELPQAEERKRRFEIEFPDFFRTFRRISGV
jgi:hypothetical protein